MLAIVNPHEISPVLPKALGIHKSASLVQCLIPTTITVFITLKNINYFIDSKAFTF